MLVNDVKLELVNRLRLEGRDRTEHYSTRYAEVTKWPFALGAGRRRRVAGYAGLR